MEQWKLLRDIKEEIEDVSLPQVSHTYLLTTPCSEERHHAITDLIEVESDCLHIKEEPEDVYPPQDCDTLFQNFSNPYSEKRHHAISDVVEEDFQIGPVKEEPEDLYPPQDCDTFFQSTSCSEVRMQTMISDVSQEESEKGNIKKEPLDTVFSQTMCDSLVLTCYESSTAVSSSGINKDRKCRNVDERPMETVHPPEISNSFDTLLLSSGISPPVPTDVVEEECVWVIKEESIDIVTCPEDFPDDDSTTEKDQVTEFSCAGCSLAFSNPIYLERHELFCHPLKEINKVESQKTSTVQHVSQQEAAINNASGKSGGSLCLETKKPKTKCKNCVHSPTEIVSAPEKADSLVPCSSCSEISASVDSDFILKEEWSTKEDSLEIITLPEDFPERNTTSTEEDNLVESVFTCAACSLVFSNPIFLERHELFCQSPKKHNDEVRITTTRQDVTQQETAISGASEMSGESLGSVKNKTEFAKTGQDCGLTSNGIKLSKQVLTRSNNSHFKCNICHAKFLTKYNLARHTKTHTGDELFSCAVCDARFVVKSTLVDHWRSHRGERPFACTVVDCGARFAITSDLTQHTMTHTGERPFACGTCDARFSHKRNLIVHARTHTGERPFVCTVVGCEARFTQSNSLKYHTRTHTGERPFACTVVGCEARFTRNSHLKSHTMIHTGERPFACGTCDAKFSHRRDLINHTRTHTGERPFVCTVVGCEARFTNRSHLLRHKMTHTRVKRFECALCQSRFKLKGNLIRHMTSHTGGKPFASTV